MRDAGDGELFDIFRTFVEGSIVEPGTGAVSWCDLPEHRFYQISDLSSFPRQVVLTGGVDPSSSMPCKKEKRLASEANLMASSTSGFAAMKAVCGDESRGGAFPFSPA